MHWKLWEQPVVYGPRKPVNGRRAARLELRIVNARAGSTRGARRRAACESFTALLSCKPLDVALRRLQYAALRKLPRVIKQVTLAEAGRLIESGPR